MPTSTLLRWSATGEAGALVVLAHGAGSGPDSPVLVATAERLAAHGHETWSFAFPYRAAGRRAPDRAPRLLAAWEEALQSAQAAAAGRPVLIGGQSMGGRIASLLAADLSPPSTAAEPAELAASGAGPAAPAYVAGLVLLAYPLVPPGSGKEARSGHWPGIRVPTLFVQGERDAFASPAVLAREAAARMGGPWTLRAIPGAGHGWRHAAVGEVADVVTGWVDTVVAG